MKWKCPQTFYFNTFLFLLLLFIIFVFYYVIIYFNFICHYYKELINVVGCKVAIVIYTLKTLYLAAVLCTLTLAQQENINLL